MNNCLICFHLLFYILINFSPTVFYFNPSPEDIFSSLLSEREEGRETLMQEREASASCPLHALRLGVEPTISWPRNNAPASQATVARASPNFLSELLKLFSNRYHFLLFFPQPMRLPCYSDVYPLPCGFRIPDRCSSACHTQLYTLRFSLPPPLFCRAVQAFPVCV